MPGEEVDGAKEVQGSADKRRLGFLVEGFSGLDASRTNKGQRQVSTGTICWIGSPFLPVHQGEPDGDGLHNAFVLCG